MKLEFINYRDLFDPEKVISSSEALVNSKKNFNDDGILSERIFGSNQDASTVDILGWIDLGKVYVISPVYYDRCKKVFSNSVFNKLINYDKMTDKKGNVIEIESKGKSFPDQYIGMIEFRKRFLELLDKYGDHSREEYQILVDAYNDDRLFTNIFPVFSPKLRPAKIEQHGNNGYPTLTKNDINDNYNFVVEYANKINLIEGDDDDDDTKLIKLPLIYQLQLYIYNITVDIIDDYLKGKKGVFRKLIVSTRVNYSSRNVITPKPNGKILDVFLPYKTFLELYRFPLINIISRSNGISLVKADKYFQSCKTHFDKKMYRYMQELLNKSVGGLKLLINRNPSINIGSMLLLNVGGIKDDFTDLTMSISNSVLSGLNADYDGDVLNIIALLCTSHKNAFESLSPENLIISKNNGKFCRDYSIAKDARCGFYILNN